MEGFRLSAERFDELHKDSDDPLLHKVFVS